MKRVSPTYAVGYTYKNKQGLLVEIVEYNGRKDITVKFVMDGALKNTTGSYIKKGLPLHPTFEKANVGDIYKCHDGDSVEIVETFSTGKVRIKWISDGVEAERPFSEVKKEFNRHPSKNKPKKGEIFESNRFGRVTVVKFNSAIDVIVSFDDGLEISVPVSRLRTGNFKHPSCGLQKGQKFVTNSGWECEVLNYGGTHNVEVKWQDGSTSFESRSNLEAGGIKPLFQPSVEGIGYFGKGRFEPHYGNGEKAGGKIYGYWTRMFSRCYNPFELNKSKNQSYRDIHVCEEWHNFQNFAEWALKQVNTPAFDFELDKDLLAKGKLIYSPDNCCFVPADINLFLMQQDIGKYYRGVNIIRPNAKSPNAKVGFVARCCTNNGREYLGFYNTPEAAFQAYKKRKESYAKELAEKWKDKIDPRAYDALMNYKVEITD